MRAGRPQVSNFQLLRTRERSNKTPEPRREREMTVPKKLTKNKKIIFLIYPSLSSYGTALRVPSHRDAS